MRVTVKGLGRLKSKINKLPQLIQEGYKAADEEILDAIEGQAKNALKKNTRLSDDNSYYVKSETREENGKTISSVYTDKDTNIYKELGTGPVGEKSQKDIPADFHPVYTQHAWFFPATEENRVLTTIYKWDTIMLGDTEFYMSFGQPARPWLYPAYRNIMNDSDIYYKRNISKALRKGL